MQETIFTVKNFKFQYKHLLIIGILAIAFSVSFMIRAQGAEYGTELNEFDPYFNFRATEYMVDNGIEAYYNWNDERSWYPHGRDIPNSSQIMLHLTAAATYYVFGAGTSLYEFTILFPAIFGSLTAIIVFAFVRVIGGTTAGLFAALFFAISSPVIVRGTIGWFKSEPLGLFYGVLGTYLFLSGIKTENRKIAIAKIIGGGAILAFGLSAWGGIQYFVIPIGIFIIALPFLRKDHNFLLWSIPLFVATLLGTGMLFGNLVIQFVTGLGGIALITATVLMIATILVYKIRKQHQTRDALIFVVGIVLVCSFLITISDQIEFINLPSFRYLNALNPFLTTQIALVDSVAEHATTRIEQSFLFHSVLMIFASLGIWLLLKNLKNTRIHKDMIAFTMIIGLSGVYVSSAFIRLEIFASIAVIIFSSVGLAILAEKFLSKNDIFEPRMSAIKIPFVIILVVLLTMPLVIPQNGTILAVAKTPATILNGGSGYGVVVDDWLVSLEWIKNNTPEDSVIASWWDYGYWIQTMGERAVLADNSTLSTIIITNIAKMLMAAPDDAWKMLQDLQADYVLIFLTGEKLSSTNGTYYGLGGGGDESKKQWFIRIAGLDPNTYLEADGITGTTHFNENTLLGQMYPFTPVVYVNFQNDIQSPTYKNGYTPIYIKDVKYPADGNGPLKLVYASPSYVNERQGAMIGVFLYEVNKDYILGSNFTRTSDSMDDSTSMDNATSTNSTSMDNATSTNSTSMDNSTSNDTSTES